MITIKINSRFELTTKLCVEKEFSTNPRFKKEEWSICCSDTFNNIRVNGADQSAHDYLSHKILQAQLDYLTEKGKILFSECTQKVRNESEGTTSH